MNLGGQEYSSEDITNWLQGKSHAEIAQQAASMGLNAGEIQQALQAGGQNYTANDINGVTASLGYNFGGAGGDIQQAPAAQASTAPGGMSIAGQYYSPQQIKDFYSGGGSDYDFLTNAGVNDATQLHEMAGRARGIAGGAAPSGEAAMQSYFNSYRKSNPGGAYANNFAAWVQDLPPNVANAMYGGGFTGDPTRQSGQDMRNAKNAGQGGVGWVGPNWGGQHEVDGPDLRPYWSAGTAINYQRDSRPGLQVTGGPTRPVGALTLADKESQLRKMLRLPPNAPIPAQYAKILGK